MEEEIMIKLELTVPEINNILAVLGEKPFAQVAGLIGNIRNQAAPQLQAAQMAEAPAEADEAAA